MSNKILYCTGCNIKVAMIAEGSKLKRGMVVLCENCDMKRKASDLSRRTETNNFNDLFGGIFK